MDPAVTKEQLGDDIGCHFLTATVYGAHALPQLVGPPSSDGQCTTLESLKRFFTIPTNQDHHLR